MRLSKRANKLEPSVTLSSAAKANELKAQGVDVLNLSLGQPDFVTPENIQKAAIQSIENGKASFYVASAGIPELRKAIIQRTKEDFGFEYQMDEVVVSDGAKFALYALFQVLLDAGDEVIVPSPYWVSYSEQIKLAEGVPVFLETQENNGFKTTAAELEQVRTDKTKLLLINSPSNPTGALYTREELEAIGQWAVQHDIHIIADEIYGKLVYNGNRFVSFIELSDEIRRQCFVVNGVSKAYSMTGWRIGYILGKKEVIKAVADLNSQSISNCAAVSQYAAIEALAGPQDSVEEMRQVFEERLNRVYPQVAALPGVSLEKPPSAFYLYPNVRETLRMCGYENVTDFVNDLLTEAHVAVVTGEGFGTSDHIRLSYAADIETIERGIERIKNFIDKKTKN